MPEVIGAAESFFATLERELPISDAPPVPQYVANGGQCHER
jgi:hypothetical protein